MSQVKYFLVFIITPAIPHGAFKMEVTFCVKAVYTPVLAKHSKHFSVEDSLAIGVDRMQRNFGPSKQQVDDWRAMQLSTAAAKLLIYQAFIEEGTGFPKHLGGAGARAVLSARA